jgi:Xaa-Pro aminopeptidase
MESDVGERLPVTGDLISGVARTAAAMGWPGNRRLETGDPVILDLAPRVAGYWGDSCNTFVIGQPTSEFRRLWDASKRGLDTARETLRPGLTAGEFDALVRGAVERGGLVNPLHIGHGIGTSSYEHPRLVPGNDAVLREGMVVMVEPGACDAAIGGVRLEWMFLVTEHGSEVLSPFQHTIAPAAAGSPHSQIEQ